MAKKSNLISFLFGESQEPRPHLPELDSDLARLFEGAAEEEALTAKQTPLTKALKKVGLDVELELDPEGFSTSFEVSADYQAAISILSQPDNMHTLAKLGWVFSRCGDVAMSADIPEFRIRFMDVAEVKPKSDDKVASMQDILKQAQQFATEAPEQDEDEDAFVKPKGGVGKAKSGSAAKNTIGEGVRALCVKDHGDFKMGDLYHVEKLAEGYRIFRHTDAKHELSESLPAHTFDRYYTVATLSGVELSNQLLESDTVIHSSPSKPLRHMGTCVKCDEDKLVSLPGPTCDTCRSRKSKPSKE